MNLAITLQVILFALLIAEIVIPSGGILFLVSAGVLIGSWFQIVETGNQEAIVIFALIDLIGIPALLWYSVKVLERSKFTLQSQLSQSDGYQVEPEWDHDLQGQMATVTQDLRPIGKIKLQDQEYEALSNHGWIESGETVEILSSTENKIIVSKTKE